MWSYAVLSLFALHSVCNGFTLGLGSTQQICVKGKLTCSPNPDKHSNVRIKLWDEDRGPNPDDLMAQGHTDADGFFELCGTASDTFGNIDPIFKVYHNCQDENTPCKRKLKFMIDDNYIGKVYDFGEIDLTLRYPGEERKCLPARR